MMCPGGVLALLSARESGRPSKRTAWRHTGCGRDDRDLQIWASHHALQHCKSELCDLQSHPRSTIATAVSPDGRLVASTHGDHSVKIVDYATGKLVRELTGHRRTPWTVHFHPTDSAIVVSGSLDSEVRLWNVNTGQLLQSRDFGRNIQSVAFHPSGKFLAVAAGRKVYLWVHNEGSKRFEEVHIVLKTSKTIRTVHFHPLSCSYILTTERMDPQNAPEAHAAGEQQEQHIQRQGSSWGSAQSRLSASWLDRRMSLASSASSAASDIIGLNRHPQGGEEVNGRPLDGLQGRHLHGPEMAQPVRGGAHGWDQGFGQSLHPDPHPEMYSQGGVQHTRTNSWQRGRNGGMRGRGRSYAVPVDVWPMHSGGERGVPENLSSQPQQGAPNAPVASNTADQHHWWPQGLGHTPPLLPSHMASGVQGGLLAVSRPPELGSGPQGEYGNYVPLGAIPYPRGPAGAHTHAVRPGGEGHGFMLGAGIERPSGMQQGVQDLQGGHGFGFQTGRGPDDAEEDASSLILAQMNRTQHSGVASSSALGTLGDDLIAQMVNLIHMPSAEASSMGSGFVHSGSGIQLIPPEPTSSSAHSHRPPGLALRLYSQSSASSSGSPSVAETSQVLLNSLETPAIQRTGDVSEVPLVTPAPAMRAYASMPSQELPCITQLTLWHFCEEEPDRELTDAQLVINGVVLCSEMGAHIAACGRLLAACTALLDHSVDGYGQMRSSFQYELKLFSLERSTMGQVIRSRPVSAGHCLTSIQFSPDCSLVLLSYGKKHESLVRDLVARGQAIGKIRTLLEVYRVSDLALVRVLHSVEDDANTACFHPIPGEGILYGTKDGKLRVLRQCQPVEDWEEGGDATVFEDELVSVDELVHSQEAGPGAC
ncbi:unnamed protein product [Ostreobium quekettii]|uniref:Uncharacterized protein n=1 Tax=Ostreobium quekettii TaxID=121088 RepID=A0A8S1IZE0_9CHLO|nr:unnamed protein product [Ostreobium quekettii]|eukprot:evm.model.scf_2466.4 EVM.evm.TU.scf_2466.4   scf_2466:16732-20058(+)